MRRALQIEINGQGERLVRIGYVAEVPLWKATYRLELGNDVESAPICEKNGAGRFVDAKKNDLQVTLSGMFRPLTMVQHRVHIAWILPLFALCACDREDFSIDAPALSGASSPAWTPAPDAVPDAPSFTLPRDEPFVPMPGPHRKRLAAAVALNATCTSCHDKQAKEWRGSYHQRANVDPAYVKAFTIEPSAFCRSCHAPEADPVKQPSADVSELGIGCVTCHVTEEGRVLAAARNEDSPHSPAPHPLRRSKAFAHQGACANCHEFRFPMPGGNRDEFFMQTTAREHVRSPSAAKACADCHMPVEGGQRSHSFNNVRDPDWLRKNINATAERTDDVLRVKIVRPNPGHDAPTGDLFRRYEVGYELRTDKGDIVRRETHYLARHFAVVPGRPGRTLTMDNRVTSEPNIVELELPREAPSSARITWWVTFQRVATVGLGEKPAESVIESEIKLHSGELPWNNNQPHSNQP